VKRKAHPDNKKKKIVAMTQKGQQALEVAGQRDALDDIIRTMSSEKYARLWDLLEELKDRAAVVSEAFE
jgi:DNA-binding MarR family transcriptional regulator